MVFPVIMYGCESWTIKKAEHRRIDAFELWCWGRLSRVPWTARRSNQSTLKEISPDCSLEGLLLKLKKLQCFSQLMWKLTRLKRPWCWERLKTGKGDSRGWDGRMASPPWWKWVWANEFEQAPGVSDGQWSLACCSPWSHKESDMTEGLNWTEVSSLLLTTFLQKVVEGSTLLFLRVLRWECFQTIKMGISKGTSVLKDLIHVTCCPSLQRFQRHTRDLSTFCILLAEQPWKNSFFFKLKYSCFIILC